MIILVFLLNSCDKPMKVETPEFTVSLANVTDEIDELGNPVKRAHFDLSGNPDLLSFYSGEDLRDYDFRNGRTVETTAVEFSFSSNSKAAGTGHPVNQLSVLISTDFNGVYDDTGVKPEQWTDITNRVTLSPLVTTDNFVPSGVVDLKEFAGENKPIYIAFRYITPVQSSRANYMACRIMDYKISLMNDLGVATVLSSQSDSTWRFYGIGEVAKERSDSNNSRIFFKGGAPNTPGIYAASSETWAILAKPVYYAASTDIGPDRPLPIKAKREAGLMHYTYDYTKPGIYKTVFVGSNVNIDGRKDKVKKLDVTIPTP